MKIEFYNKETGAIVDGDKDGGYEKYMVDGDGDVLILHFDPLYDPVELSFPVNDIGWRAVEEVK